MKKNTFVIAYHLIPPSHRRKGIWIVVLLIVNSVLDFFSVAFFIPLIFLVINPSFVSSNTVTSALYSFSGVESIKSFIILMTLGVLIFVLAKNLVSVGITRIKVKYAFEIGQQLSSNAVAQYIQISFLDFSQVDFTRELNRITNYPFAFANNVIVPVANIIS